MECPPCPGLNTGPHRQVQGRIRELLGDPDYEPYDPACDADRFDRAVQSTATTAPRIFSVRPAAVAFQREMLQRLDAERERHHRYRNLVVAATGTGKTLVAAFDYRHLRERLATRVCSSWLTAGRSCHRV